MRSEVARAANLATKVLCSTGVDYYYSIDQGKNAWEMRGKLWQLTKIVQHPCQAPELLCRGLWCVKLDLGRAHKELELVLTP